MTTTNSPVFKTSELHKLGRDDFRQAIRAEGQSLKPIIAQDRHPGAEQRTEEIQSILSEIGCEEAVVVPDGG